MEKKKWLTTEYPEIFFENNSVGRLKKEIWDASEAEIDAILTECGIPSPSELGKAGCYIQNTPRTQCIERRKKNDIVFVPIGCTENHGHLWMLESAIQEFMKRFQLPALVQVLDWHRAVREFFMPVGRDDSLETHFIHADESETAVGLLLFPEMIDMSVVQDSEGEGFLPDGHFDLSVDPYRRPHRWSEGEGHLAIERFATPEGVVGSPSKGTAGKAKRPIAAIVKYLALVNEQILEAFPAGTVPPPDKVSLRDPKELEPFLKEPFSEGWKSVYELPAIGPFTKG